jgi:hypothetical protein
MRRVFPWLGPWLSCPIRLGEVRNSACARLREKLEEKFRPNDACLRPNRCE